MLFARIQICIYIYIFTYLYVYCIYVPNYKSLSLYIYMHFSISRSKKPMVFESCHSWCQSNVSDGRWPGRVPREGDKVQLGQLVGGWTNPSEKYVCQIGNLPQIGVKRKNMSKPPDRDVLTRRMVRNQFIKQGTTYLNNLFQEPMITEVWCLCI